MEKTPCRAALSISFHKLHNFRLSIDKLNVHHRTIRDIWATNPIDVQRRRYSYATSTNRSCFAFKRKR